MREIVFEDLTRKQRNKRALAMHETLDRDGYLYTADRKTIFKLKGIRSFDDSADANKWICKQLSDQNASRRLSLLKVCNEEKDENLWQSKLIDTLYILRGNFVFSIAFFQMIRVRVHKRMVV
ncbi:MAG: hypothetical protein HQ572_05630 [Candidatus Omnitrophica bacterium]|nr:hypothetical protein [Candidatus Omnitrophota bacterium]